MYLIRHSDHSFPLLDLNSRSRLRDLLVPSVPASVARGTTGTRGIAGITGVPSSGSPTTNTPGTGTTSKHPLPVLVYEIGSSKNEPYNSHASDPK